MQINILQAGQKQLLSAHAVANIMVDISSRQYALYAAKDFESAETICSFSTGKTFTIANQLTIQTGEHSHITLTPSFLQYINHSCDPNTFFDTEKMWFIAIKKIMQGDELRFFYPATEWDMAAPFICNCGSKECLQLINGAAHLSFATLKKYRLTNFIQGQSSRKFPVQ